MAGPLVAFSHLRWTWVWQRTQHLVSRLAQQRPVYFVEEPVAAPVGAPVLRVETQRSVRRVWMEVPRGASADGGASGAVAGFGDPRAAGYGEQVAGLLEPGRAEIAWISTPFALGHARALDADTLVYDVMDDLAALATAPQQIPEWHTAALDAAHLVLAGGPSLHAAVRERAGARAHLLPSGVEREHFATVRRRRRPHDRPVAGYVGVVDERLDLQLVAELADRLPDWSIELVGPVARIDPATLPRRPNLRHAGMQPYAELPAVMARLDVALVPFALDASTRFSAPTKTLEYVAAGLPVVSTPVPDVVADLGDIVAIAAGPADFAAACRRVEAQPAAAGDPGIARVLRRRHWDGVAARLDDLIDAARVRRGTQERMERA